MDFKTILDGYIKKLDCTANTLAKHANLTPTIISRYRSSKRVPKTNSIQFELLIKGIVSIAKEKNIKEINKDIVYKDFISVMGDTNYDIEVLRENLNTIIDLLKINIAEVSRYLGYDPSHISKIRSGIRKPAHPNQLIDGICNYIVQNYTNDVDAICTLIKIDKTGITDSSKYYSKLKEWLCNNKEKSVNYIDNFFKYIGDFNFEKYISIIKFNEVKIPYVPFRLPKSKNYYGIEEMKQAELDFFKATVLSKSKNDIFMCSDMQMDDMAKDIEFAKKWMFGIAMCLKRGLHLNIIHDIERPFNEMMIGLESWIPIYMTGQVSPFYLKNNQNKIYSHLNYVSGDYSLTGECLKGYHDDGKYYLTNNKKENDYYKKKTNKLLKIASPLMEIYKENNKTLFNNFLDIDASIKGERKRILSSLPFHTISNGLLLKILKDNNINKDKIIEIQKYHKQEKDNINKIIKNNVFIDEFHKLSKKEFNSNAIFLDVDKYFCHLELKYTYETYTEHYNETKNYEKKNENYSLINNNNVSFNNIDIYVNKSNYVIITKKKNPNIQFVIKHNKMVNAIENFIPPIIER